MGIIAQEKERRKFNKMWNYLLYKKQELERDKGLCKDLSRLFLELLGHGIAIEAAESGTLLEYMRNKCIPPDQTLVIAARDCTLDEIADFPVAAVGYPTAGFPAEGLYGADMLVCGFEEVDYRFLERVYRRKHGIPWHILKTKRCYVREMQILDLPELYRLYEGAGMTDYMEPLYDPKTEEEYTKAYIENMYRYYGFGMWLVKDRATRELIGRAGFDLTDFDGERLLEMGYAIAAPRQRMGYASEVCTALLAYAKEELDFARVDCFVREGNAASIALLLKLGFLYQGTCVRDKKQMLRYYYLL